MYIVINSFSENNIPNIGKVYICGDYESALYHATQLAIELGFDFTEVKSCLDIGDEYIQENQVIGIYKSG